MQTVLALVLTYNAPETLRQCVARVRGQLAAPDRLIVVDNASRDPADRVLAEHGLVDERVRVLRMERNLGPAGGYARGLSEFLNSDADFVWIVDDDMLPGDGTLAALRRRAAGSSEPMLLFPTVVDENSGRSFDYPAWCGVLLPRIIVERVGLPRADYFWWAEDTEYLQWRIPRAGFETVRCPEARVVHQAVRRARFKPTWKYYYEARNMLHYRFHVQVPGGVSKARCVRKSAWSLTRMVGRITVAERDRGRKLVAIARGIKDGLSGSLGIRMETETG